MCDLEVLNLELDPQNIRVGVVCSEKHNALKARRIIMGSLIKVHHIHFSLRFNEGRALRKKSW